MPNQELVKPHQSLLIAFLCLAFLNNQFRKIEKQIKFKDVIFKKIYFLEMIN